MVRFYCDRCNAEVENTDELLEIVIEGRERSNMAAWSWRSEVCRPCYDALKEAINNLVNLSDESKRKPVRRATS